MCTKVGNIRISADNGDKVKGYQFYKGEKDISHWHFNFFFPPKDNISIEQSWYQNRNICWNDSYSITLHHVGQFEGWPFFFFYTFFLFFYIKWLKHSCHVYHPATVFLLCCCCDITRQQDVALIKCRSVLEFPFLLLTVFLMQMVLYNIYLSETQGYLFIYIFFFKLKCYCCFQAPWSSVQEQPSQAEQVCTFSVGFDHKSNAEVGIRVKQKPHSRQCRRNDAKAEQWNVTEDHRNPANEIIKIQRTLPCPAGLYCSALLVPGRARVWMAHVTGVTNYQTMQCINVCTDKWLSPQEKKKKKSHSMKQSRMKNTVHLCQSDFSLWCLLWPVTPVCLPSMCHSSNKHSSPDSHISSLFMSQLWKTQAPLNHGEQDTPVFTSR